MGLLIDDELSFKQHVDLVKQRIRPVIPVMWRVGKYLPDSSKKSLYFSLVFSHINYMIPIYGNCVTYKINELQVLQNRCIKSILNVRPLTPTSYLYSYSVLPIKTLHISQCLILIHRMLNGFMNHNFVFTTNAEVHGRINRRANHIHISNLHPILNDMLIEYNQLDQIIKSVLNVKDFKQKINVNLMTFNENFNPISPYVMLN